MKEFKAEQEELFDCGCKMPKFEVHNFEVKCHRCYKSFNKLEPELRELRKSKSDLDIMISWLRVMLPELDCRGDEDCDHCYMTGLVAEIDKYGHIQQGRDESEPKINTK